MMMALALLGSGVRAVGAEEAATIHGKGHALLAGPGAGPILFGIHEKCTAQDAKEICDLENQNGICRGICDRSTRVCAPTISACFPCHPPLGEDGKPLTVNRCSRGGFFCTERTNLGGVGCGPQTIGDCLPAGCKKKDIITCTANCADTLIPTGNPCGGVDHNCP